MKTKKAPYLTENRKRAIKKALPFLRQMGAELPKDMLAKLEGRGIKLKRAQVHQIEAVLGPEERCVIVARKGKFKVFTIEGYATMVKNGKRLGRLGSGPKAAVIARAARSGQPHRTLNAPWDDKEKAAVRKYWPHLQDGRLTQQSFMNFFPNRSMVEVRMAAIREIRAGNLQPNGRSAVPA